MLQNLLIRTRLILLILITSLIMITIGSIGYDGITSMTDWLNLVYSGSVDSIQELIKIKNIYAYEVKEPLYKLQEGIITWDEALKTIVKVKAEEENIWEDYLKTGLLPIEKEKARHTESLLHDVDVFLTRLTEALEQRNMDKVHTFVTKDIYNFLDPILRQIDTLIEQHVNDTSQQYVEAAQSARETKNFMLVSIILGIVMSILLCLVLIRSITYPLAAAVKVVKKLALGEDISVPVEFSSEDEIGELLSAIQSMVDSNKKMISVLAVGDLTTHVPLRSDKDVLTQTLNHVIGKLRQTILEVQAEANVLAKSTQDILISITQASTGTTETAAAVSETTTTTEELRQTAHVTADKAKDVLTSAEGTLQTVHVGETSLKGTIEDMAQIQEKMKVISDSIIKFSDQSVSISEIIDTVDDLAEQSNLLAVNAAIEAAKSGEQGKGFGVVAQEIRVLAEQSKTATIQARAILNDIQNATGKAVMATEQGSKAVAKGVSQSMQLSEAIRSLSVSISKVAQAANQIAISSQQQLVGVDQVTIAMTNINEASNQHVEHMRQIEAAVTALNAAGGSLKALTEQYKL